MTTHQFILACAALGCLATSQPCGSQTTAAPPTLVQQLQSANWVQRATAFQALQRNATSWTTPAMATVLVQLLEREDRLTMSVLRESNNTIGVADNPAYGEAFSEYTAAVTDACVKYCDKNALLAEWFRQIFPGSPVGGGIIDLLGIVHNNHGFSIAQRLRMDSVLLVAATDSTSYLTRASAL